MRTGAGATELIVVRHGQSTWNVESRFTGQADPPLSDVGRIQASDLAARCAPLGLDAVVTSDLVRAFATGLVVADDLALPRPTQLPLLRERWSGVLQGRTRDEIERRFPGQLAVWREAGPVSLPGENEAFDAFARRVTRGLVAASKLGHRVLVVSHAGVFVVLDQLTGSYDGGHTANAEGRRLWVSGGRIVDSGVSFETDVAALRSGTEDP